MPPAGVLYGKGKTMAKKKEPNKGYTLNQKVKQAQEAKEILNGEKPQPPAQDGTDSQPKKNYALHISNGTLIGIIVGVFVTLLLVALVLGIRAWVDSDNIRMEQKNQDTSIEQSLEHRHTWSPNYETVHHDAEYKDVWHEPVYGEETTYHTVCNTCKEIIDGEAAKHIADTGHSGYSTDVPITDEIVVQEGYFEPVLVTEAYDETVVESMVCTACGEEITVEEALEQGITVPLEGEILK